MAKKTPDPKKSALREVPPPAPAASASAEKDSKIDARLAIPLDADGRVLVENMRETSKEKLKSLFSDAKLARELGVSSSENVAAAPGLRPELMYPLIAGLSFLDMLVVVRFAPNAPRELVERVVPYSQEEADLLAPAMTAVIDKHGGGTFLAKYREEIDLGGLLIAMTARKIQVIREEVAKLGPRPVVVPFTGDAPKPAQPEEPKP